MSVSRLLYRGRFTGWHMLAGMCLFFGVIISVNITMAYFANSSWSGLIVKNTYVASQKFDEDVSATEKMKAKGWLSQLDVSDEAVNYSLTNALGSAIAADAVILAFNRPVGIEQDSVITLQPAKDGGYRASHGVAAGQWLVKVTAVKDGENIYTDVQRIYVGNSRSGG
ncbi:MAG: FixH family protein [Pseudomonadota bacterium]